MYKMFLFILTRILLIDMEAVQRGSKVVDELKEQLFRLKGPLGLTNENERNCHPLICLV